MCHGFGAASFIPCDRCGGTGKRSHDNPLSNAGTAQASIDCGCLHHPTGTDSGSGGNRRSRSGCLKGEGIRVEGGVPGDDKDEGIASETLKLTRTADCAKCSGLGRVPAPQEEGKGSYCTHCAGARFVEESVTLRVSIPRGVEEGHIALYRGEGHVDIAGESNRHFSVFSITSLLLSGMQASIKGRCRKVDL